MKKQLQSVEKFHNAFNEVNGESPILIPEDKYILRHKLMAEENDEYLGACEKNDIVEVADALGDQLYILCGTILKHGMQNVIEEVFNEIQRSNMSKFGEDGKPFLRDDGKLLKGPNYFKPNLEKVLEDFDQRSKAINSWIHNENTSY